MENRPMSNLIFLYLRLAELLGLLVELIVQGILHG